MRLSVCMIVKNEQANLPRCLESLSVVLNSVKSEVIIVDTGSTDKTVEIAKKYTKKVYIHPWNGDFAEMRNRAISYAQGEWIFILDADEELTQPRGLIKFLNSKNRNKYNSASISLKNVKKKFGSDGGYQDISRIPLVRLFKNDGNFRYENPIHEQPRYKAPVLFLADTLVTHYGYDLNDKQLMDYKFERNVESLKKELEKDPENIYYIFQMSQSYSMYGKKELALEEAERAYKVYKSKGIPGQSCLFIFSQLAICYSNCGKSRALKDICLEGLAIEPDGIDMYFFLGKAYLRLEEFEKSIEAYNKYFVLLENYENTAACKNTSLGTLSIYNQDDALISLALDYFCLDDYEKAKVYLGMIQAKDTEDYLKMFVRICFKQFAFLPLKEYYDKLDKEYRDKLIPLLEFLRKELETVQNQHFLEIFSDGDTDYSLLNKIRLGYKRHHDIMSHLLHFNENFNWNKSNLEIYGECLYYSMVSGIPIEDILATQNQNQFVTCFTYLNRNFSDLGKVIKVYLPTVYGNGLQQAKIRKNLLYILLMIDESYNYYEKLFRIYINNGIQYIQGLYAKEVLEKEWVHELKNEEEVFFLYIHKSDLYFASGDIKGAIAYLKKAINEYPIMSKGVRGLLNQIKEQIMNGKPNLLGEYQTILIHQIENLINSGKIDEAKKVIIEYETIVKEDFNILSCKAVINILENNYKEAEAILLEGLIINPSDFDVHFNLAYLYQTMEEPKLALMYYKKARNLAPQDKIILVDNAIKNIV